MQRKSSALSKNVSSSSRDSPKAKKSRISKKDNLLFVALISVAVCIIVVNMTMQHHMHQANHISSTKQRFFSKTEKNDVKNDISSTDTLKAGGGSGFEGTLTCKNYNNGLTKESMEEMIYWRDIPGDKDVNEFASPFYEPDKYLLFQPDHGGWNNIRMAMETNIVLAIGTGRTLVLPPEAEMYLLKSSFQSQKKEFGFNDFFDLKALMNDHSFINIITMEEFLVNHLPKLINPKTNKPYPKISRTKWDGGRDLHLLWRYLNENSYVDETWQPGQCLAVIPDSTDGSHTNFLHAELRKVITGKKSFTTFTNNPTPVNADLFKRAAELEGERKFPCIYDEKMQFSPLLFFPVSAQLKLRMLTHFYSFVTFEDWKQDLWMKRLVRDYIHYKDEFICVGARIVQEIRKKAREHDPSNLNGSFDAFHVRRGDFQYKKIKLSAQELYASSKGQLQEGGTLYIATDERDKSFFDIFKKHYNVLFLDDFEQPYLHGMNTNFYGMMDQIIASRSRVFFGSYRSTFTGYINRMRGYYSTKYKLPGYKDGILDSWYFTPNEFKEEMRKYMSVRLPLYMREFPVAWRDIDFGVEE